jgi:hypothetical protein
MEHNLRARRRARPRSLALPKKHKGLWIPNSIYLDPSFNADEKIILAEILTLQKTAGCFAGNEHFARRLGVGERQFRNRLSSLLKRGAVRVENHGSKRRRLWVNEQIAGRDPDVAPPESNEGLHHIDAATHDIGSAKASALAGNDAASEEADSFIQPANSFPPTRKDPATENTLRSQREITKENTDMGFGVGIPDWMPASEWSAWLAFCSEQGWPMSEKIQRAQIQELVKLDRACSPPDEVIRQSISKRWKGFYELPMLHRPGMHRCIDGVYRYKHGDPFAGARL